MEITQQPFTNLQLELLKVFALHVKDNDLIEIKKMLADYFAKKSMDEADKVWEAKGWTDEDAHRMVKEHMRTTYKRK